MFRNRWTVLIALLLILATLTACGNPSPAGDSGGAATGEPAAESTEPVTIRYGWFGNPDQEPVAMAMVDEFMKQNPHITVEFENIPYQGFWEKLMTSVAGDSAPDVLRLTSYWGFLLGQEGAALDMQPLMPEGYLEDFDPVLLEYAAPGGKVYGIPQSNNVQVLIYNKDMFAQAGIEAPTNPEEAWTWEEMMQQCDVLMEQVGVQHCYGIYPGAPQGRLINIYQTGGGILDVESGASTLNTPESVAGLEIIKQLYDGGYIHPTSWTTNYDLTKEFTAGNIAMFHGGNFNLATLEKTMSGKYGVTFLPRNPETISMVGGEVYSITSGTDHPEAAWKLVEFMSNAENTTRWTQATVAIPPRLSLIGAIDYGIYNEHMELIAQASTFGNKQILKEFQVDGWSKVDTMLRERTVQLFSMPAQAWADETAAEIDRMTTE